MLVETFKPPFSIVNRTASQKINREIENTTNQLYMTNIYKTLHLTKYTFFSSAHGTFSGINHMLNHKISLSKLKMMEVILYLFSDHN